MKRRHAISFTPIIRGDKDQSKQVADQLNELIKKYEQQGWQFCQLENITSIKPGGCLGGQPETHSIQVAAFEADQ